MILNRPISPSVYLTVRFFIGFSPFTPVTRADDANAARAPCEPDRHHIAFNHAETEIALLLSAVLQILRKQMLWIEKCMLGQLERNAVLEHVDARLCLVPFEYRCHILCHTF